MSPRNADGVYKENVSSPFVPPFVNKPSVASWLAFKTEDSSLYTMPLAFGAAGFPVPSVQESFAIQRTSNWPPPRLKIAFAGAAVSRSSCSTPSSRSNLTTSFLKRRARPLRRNYASHPPSAQKRRRRNSQNPSPEPRRYPAPTATIPTPVDQPPSSSSLANPYPHPPLSLYFYKYIDRQ